MNISKLRFVVDSVGFVVAGGGELEGDALRGLREILEDAYMEIQREHRHLQEKLQGLEQASVAVSNLKAAEIAEYIAKVLK